MDLMRFQFIETQQIALSAVRLTATPPIIHSNVGAKMRDFFTRGKINSVVVGGAVLFALSACGGGSGNGSTAQTDVINGIPVPKEPDATLNNATLAGVDSNSNGVRDDVERKIAEKSGNMEVYKNSLALAREMSIVVASSRMTQTQMDAYQLRINCLSLKTDVLPTVDYAALILNSVDRKIAYKENTQKFKGGFFSAENNACPV